MPLGWGGKIAQSMEALAVIHHCFATDIPVVSKKIRISMAKGKDQMGTQGTLPSPTTNAYHNINR